MARGTTADRRPAFTERGARNPARQGARLGGSASGLPGLFGIIRGHEVNTPDTRSSMPCKSRFHTMAPCGDQLQNKIVWPAISTDWFCKSRPELCSGNIPYGALLALPPSVNIAGLGLSEPGRRLAAALQNYGTYAVDGTVLPELAGRPGDRSRGQAGADQGHAENLSALAHGAEQQGRADRFRRRNAPRRELRLRFTRSLTAQSAGPRMAAPRFDGRPERGAPSVFRYFRLANATAAADPPSSTAKKPRTDDGVEPRHCPSAETCETRRMAVRMPHVTIRRLPSSRRIGVRPATAADERQSRPQFLRAR